MIRSFKNSQVLWDATEGFSREEQLDGQDKFRCRMHERMTEWKHKDWEAFLVVLERNYGRLGAKKWTSSRNM